MKAAEARTRMQLNNILYLTDFSEPSEAALPFAASIAREYASTIRALHVLVPAMCPYTPPELVKRAAAAQEECAKSGMQRLADQLTGLPHNTIVERGAGVWETLEPALKAYHIDLIVLGTHGRTGAGKLLLGSVAEEVFRRSSVPVLTIGPRVHQDTHNNAKFQRVLFATDFTPESIAAVPCAILFAEEHQARLTLLHIIPERPTDIARKQAEDNVATAMYELSELVPSDAVWWCQPEAVVEYGNPAQKILEVAKQRGADLIVLGVRDANKRMGAATHLEWSTAHKVVAQATCPVLTVRGQER
jgi:nucleotide-binding universal stress UspA family protein